MILKKTLQYSLYLVLFCVLLACNNQPKLEDTQMLNGYWEIEEVKKPNGQIVAFKFNENVDYIELENGEGFRQKTRPQFTGGYQSNGVQEAIKVLQQGDSLVLQYSTPQDSWQETLLQVAPEQFKVRNPQGIIYTYKKFEGYDYGEK